MFDFVDICRNAQTITTSIVYSSENVKLPDGAYIPWEFYTINLYAVDGLM